MQVRALVSCFQAGAFRMPGDVFDVDDATDLAHVMEVVTDAPESVPAPEPMETTYFQPDEQPAAAAEPAAPQT